MIHRKSKGKKKQDPSQVKAKEPPHVTTLNKTTREKKLLVMDLDETLVHSSTHSNLIDSSNNRIYSSASIELYSSAHSVPILYYIYKRPNLEEFLKQVSQWFDLAIYTSSVKKYADFVVEEFKIPVEAGMRFYRDDCEMSSFEVERTLTREQKVALQDPTAISAEQILVGNVVYRKNLRRVCNRWIKNMNFKEDEEELLKDVILMDNSTNVMQLQPTNGFPVKEWICEPNDTTLLDILPVLDALRYVQDVRNVLGLRLF